MRPALAALALVVAACGADAIPVPDHAPAPPDPAAPAPQVIIDARPWYLAGDALTPADPRFLARADGPASVVDVWLDGAHVARAHLADGTFDLGFDLADVAIGDHTVLVSADGAEVAFAELPLHKSAALYVAVSNDWDTGDHTDDKLERQDRLHAAHPRLVLTHFVGPYTFTDPTVAPARAQLLVDWVLRNRAEHGDEIGLHIHPYCNFVTAAGVTCRTAPSFRDATDATGYTVHRVGVAVAVDHQLDRDRQPEQRRRALDGLDLLDPHLAQPGRAIPAGRDLELGVAGPGDPLVEEAVEGAPGGLGDGAREVAGLDRAVAVLDQVVAQARPEAGVAELAPQHVQHPRALLVEVVIEDVDRLVVDPGRDRPPVAVAVLGEVHLEPLVELEVGGVAALVVRAPDVLGVGGERLVEPQLRPPARRDEIAEPLVGQLVGEQALYIELVAVVAGHQGEVGEAGEGGVLHAPPHEFPKKNMAIARIGVGRRRTSARTARASPACAPACAPPRPRGRARRGS
jgi:hypothetical protein